MKTLKLMTFLSLACITFAQAPAPAAADEPQTTTVTLEILGMVTPNCPVLVEAAVGKVDGVKEVDASLKKKNARITYDAARTSAEAIRRVIKDRVGFDSRVADRK
jgi:copper chaperone CopZ